MHGRTHFWTHAWLLAVLVVPLGPTHALCTCDPQKAVCHVPDDLHWLWMPSLSSDTNTKLFLAQSEQCALFKNGCENPTPACVPDAHGHLDADILLDGRNAHGVIDSSLHTVVITPSLRSIGGYFTVQHFGSTFTNLTFSAELRHLSAFIMDTVRLSTVELPAQLTSINDIIIKSNHGLTSLKLPPALRRMHNLRVESNSDLINFQLPLSLTDVLHDVQIQDNQRVTSFSLPALRNVGGKLQFNGNEDLTILEIPELRRVGSNVSVWSDQQQCEDKPPLFIWFVFTILGQPNILNCSMAKEYRGHGGHLELSYCDGRDGMGSLTRENCPISCGACMEDQNPEEREQAYWRANTLEVRNNGALTNLSLPSLSHVNGYVDVGRNDALTSLELRQLRSTGGIWIQHNDALVAVDVGVDTTMSNVGDAIWVEHNVALNRLELSRTLRTVHGNFVVFENSALSSLELSLHTVGQRLSIHDNHGLTKLDMRRLVAVRDVVITQNAPTSTVTLPCAVKSNDTFSSGISGVHKVYWHEYPTICHAGTAKVGHDGTCNECSEYATGVGACTAAAGACIRCDVEGTPHVEPGFVRFRDIERPVANLSVVPHVYPCAGAACDESAVCQCDPNQVICDFGANLINAHGQSGRKECVPVNGVLGSSVYVYDNANVETIDLSGVKSIGSLVIVACPNLHTIFAPNVTKAGNVTVQSCNRLESISLPSAASTGSLDVSSCSALSSLDVGSVERIDGGLSISNVGNLRSIELNVLNDVSSSFSIVGASADVVTTLPCSARLKPWESASVGTVKYSTGFSIACIGKVATTSCDVCHDCVKCDSDSIAPVLLPGLVQFVDSTAMARRERDSTSYVFECSSKLGCHGTNSTASVGCISDHYDGHFCMSCASGSHHEKLDGVDEYECAQCVSTTSIWARAFLSVAIITVGTIGVWRWNRRPPKAPKVAQRTDTLATSILTDSSVENPAFNNDGHQAIDLSAGTLDSGGEGINADQTRLSARLQVVMQAAFQPMRMVITWAQVTAQIGSVLQVHYPPVFASAVKVLRYVQDVRNVLFDVECSGMDGFVARWLVNVVLLPAATMLCMIAAYSWFRKQTSTAEAVQKAKSYSYGAVFILYPSICNSAFTAFECRELLMGDIHVSILEDDDRLLCTDEAMKLVQSVSLVVIMVVAVGVPMIFSVLLLRNAHEYRRTDSELNAAVARQLASEFGVDEEVADFVLRDVLVMGQSFSFLMDAFKDRCYYWEILDILRKLLLVGLVLLVDRGSVAQSLVALILSFFFFALQAGTQPYKLPQDNAFRAATEVQVFLVIAVGLALHSDVSNEQVDASWYDWGLFVSFVVLVPGAFCVTVASKVLSASKSLVDDSLVGSFERLRLGLASSYDRTALRTRVEAMKMASSDTIRRIVVSSPEWATKDPEGNGPYDQPAMDRCKELQQLGLLKIAFDRAGTTTARQEDEELFERLQEATDLAECAQIVKKTYWFYGYATAVKRCIVLESQGFKGRLELICIRGGAITQVEAQEMELLVADAKKDAELSDIVIECEIKIREMSFHDFIHEMNTAAGTSLAAELGPMTPNPSVSHDATAI